MPVVLSARLESVPAAIALKGMATVVILVGVEDAPLPGAQPRAHYWITGVSGTTDIEGSYVRGAHGPRFLHVILLRE